MCAPKKAASAKRTEAVASKAPAAALLSVVRTETAAVLLIVVRPETAAAPLTAAKLETPAALLMGAAVKPMQSAALVSLAVPRRRKQLRERNNLTPNTDRGARINIRAPRCLMD